MKMPVQVVFRNMDKTPWIEDMILEKASGLERFHHHIIGCRVVVELPHRRHHQGNRYQVRIDLSVPEKEIVVTRSDEHKEHEDIVASVRDAFDSAKRQLEEYSQKRRGDVKAHAEAPYAKVVRLFLEEEYGFIETIDGRELYFHAHSVLNGDFSKLVPGVHVMFVEENGDNGPQASTVRIAA